MFDIKLIRENPEAVKQMLAARQKPMDSVVDSVLELDERRRQLLSQIESLRAEQNIKSKAIGKLKATGEEVPEAVSAGLKELSGTIKELEQQLTDIDTEQTQLTLSIPNILDSTVPYGKDSDENVELRRFGTVPSFDFQPLPHWELGEKLGILDPESANRVTGSRFHFYRGLGARLERSLISFFLDTHSKHGYTELLPPNLASTAAMVGTGQLPKFAEDMYKIEGEELYLIPTAEVTVTNIHRESILDGNTLPLSYCAYSVCFRAEAGSAGRDTRGLIRQHQFNKVELVKFTTPEQSAEEHEKLTADAERILQLLELPYRVVYLCSGDVGFSSAKTYDIEVWMPSYNKYVEISSCSNFLDFQARRAKIRYKNDVKDKTRLVHTLNGSGLAVGRTVAAIMENYQLADGSIAVPKALQPYMNCERIS